MAVITLTSDYGTSDHYVAAVKAALIGLAPQIKVVDISHQVPPFDIHEAAFILGSVWQLFPMGSVHLIGVNAEWTSEQPHVVVHYMSHYFICSDNGIFSLLFKEIPEDIFELSIPQQGDWSFPMKGVFAIAAAHLAKGGMPEFLGRRIHSLRSAMVFKPVVEEDRITAHAIHIDHYGNIYTNLERSLFDAVRRDRQFYIELTRDQYRINKIVHHFAEAGVADQVAIWASNGYLLLGMYASAVGYGGGAARLWGMEKKDPIRIIFYGSQNRENDL